jgi:hypothetical protein
MTQVKAQDILALTYWVKVVRVEKSDKLLVEDLNNNNKFYVQGKELIDTVGSADNYQTTKKVGKMEGAEMLTQLYGKPVTVNYDKADGSNRTLRGKLLSSESLLGRSYFEDLDLPAGEHRTRLVDHRTLHYFIVDGVKYVVGK